MLRAFLKDGFIYSIPAFISRGLAFILVPLYTRVLNPSDYGSLDLLFVFASIVNIIITLEICQGVARFYVDEKDSIQKILYASSALWFTFICNFVFVCVAFLISDWLAPLIMGQDGLQVSFQIGLCYIFANSIFYFVQNQLRWERRATQYAMMSLLMTFVTAGVSVWLAFFLQWGLVGLLIGMLAGTMLASILGLWWLRGSFQFRFSSAQLSEMLRFSSPLVISGIAVWISLYIDRMMINYFLSTNEVGLYGIGHRLASIASLVMVGFQSALTPLIYANYQNTDTPRQLERIFRFFLFFALLIFLSLTIFSSKIIQIVVAPPFYEASILIVFLVPAILLSNMYIFSPGIGIAKKTHFIIWINVGGGVLNVILNYFLIPVFGISGAAIATMLSYASTFAAYTIIGQYFYSIPHNWICIFKSIAAVILIIVILDYLPSSAPISFVLKLLGLIVFFLLTLSFGLIKRGEILSGWNLLKNYRSSRL